LHKEALKQGLPERRGIPGGAQTREGGGEMKRIPFGWIVFAAIVIMVFVSLVFPYWDRELRKDFARQNAAEHIKEKRQ
jgi:hypothetical protein